ncbi:ABC transporter permease [Polynucleobacter sp. MG-27-Goln-C1]|uniref:ABC transporter permease n=1 Tax=Polynucleobacter sp. MG-27-Goln-C1 TaxID=1819726 RepID=UPI001C0DB73A|nr:ABC transporter permease [Polynucleobacter sp. MG-27-Goln-C1]MBU3612844.1 ABC transporter permease [Polynucleobacter sp. MG-27-Goln-C1]
MNPLSIRNLFKSIATNRELIYQMTEREVLGRYRGSIFGIAWSFLNPILMLVIYTLVFSVVFKARWGFSTSESKVEFALILFTGMIVFNFFAEVINRAPFLIIHNVNYVKKVVFPLEILSIVSIGAALIHAFISFLILFVGLVALDGPTNLTILYVPVIFIPFIVMSLGISWILASLGVYIRDISQVIGVFTSVLMFLSPVFYPLDSLPAELRIWVMLNPATFIIEQVRQVVIVGDLPDWGGLGLYAVIAIFLMYGGYVWFQKTRRGFADVL